MANIYFYDNNTGRNIPEDLSGHKTTTLLGSTVDEIKNSILPESLGFCVFTNLKGTSDFVVFKDSDKEILQNLFSLSNTRYNVDVVSQSMWLSDKVNKTIIVSGNIDITDQKLRTVLTLFFGITDKGYNEGEVRTVSLRMAKPSTDYYVFNIRNNTPIIKVPSLEYAVEVCDKNPCCVVKNSSGEIVHRSVYGKVTLNKSDPVYELSVPKESITDKGRRVAFNINK